MVIRDFGACMLALAALGKTEAAQALLNASTFILEKTTVKPPSGWTSLDEFNADLSREITSNRDLRFERYGTSSAKAWRVDHPATDESSAVQALLKQIAEIAEKHAGQIAVGDHCWLAARPAKAELRSWCVMTESDGYERWHMHPDGWMSGGYYVEVPDGLADTHDKAGCLAFGLPKVALIGEAAAEAFGERLVRPKPGLLTLFPSLCLSPNLSARHERAADVHRIRPLSDLNSALQAPPQQKLCCHCSELYFIGFMKAQRTPRSDICKRRIEPVDV